MGSNANFEEHLAALSPPLQVLTEFVTDSAGILTRIKTAIDSKAGAAASPA